MKARKGGPKPRRADSGAPLDGAMSGAIKGRGPVESPDHPQNTVWQTRTGEPSAYENALGDALEAILGAGVHDLSGIVAGLNAAGVRAPDGAAWSEESFMAEMKRLGA